LATLKHLRSPSYQFILDKRLRCKSTLN